MPFEIIGLPEIAPWKRSVAYLLVLLGVLWLITPGVGRQGKVAAQEATEAGPSAEPAPTGNDAAAEPTLPPGTDGKEINILKLAFDGGIFMIPLVGLSLLVVTIGVERLIGLRKSRVLPEGLVTELGKLGAQPSGFDPRKAYRICQQYPSAAARVVRAMLLKVGRPLSEVEHTVKETSEREATRLYRNVRWLDLASSTSTLIGLIGTIQGMILAFHKLTIIEAGADKGKALADGIYVALVTTFAGLVIAIPAGALSHYFEGRIQDFFYEIDELVYSLLPQVERYEGRLRFSRQAEDDAGETPVPRTADRPSGAGTPV